MILADKIIKLRKKNGWSQEELADKMQVTRQSVSKWEGAQSVPDLEKILLMGRIFGVSTDYLLKDEIEETDAFAADEDEGALRRVSLQEASNFLKAKQATAKPVAFATALCILSPVCLLMLGGASEARPQFVSEAAATAVGMTVLLLMVAVAVAIFIASGSKTAPFQYLETEIFETEYGVTGMVEDRKRKLEKFYSGCNISGACICILAAVPIFGAAFWEEDVLFGAGMVALTLCFAAVGVSFFILGGIPWASLQKLLQEGDYTRRKKKNSRFTGPVHAVYWLVVIAAYLGYSFVTDNWQRSWIIWPVAGVLCAALGIVCDAVADRKSETA